MTLSAVLNRLPADLRAYVCEQGYENYTPENQAVWRFVMHQNRAYLPHVAHHAYLDGLAATGIAENHIPSIEEMNECLSKIGWAAVAVDGFIPPAAFMAFQAHKVLVIAAAIRSVNQVEYTPAPDILHEAAGHAPIIAVPEYADYLVRFGELGTKAFSSAYDFKMYEAVRHLSVLKESALSTEAEIAAAEQQLSDLAAEVHQASEMARLRNLHWWTVEYGLISDTDGLAKIYGAGLLSSIGESFSCLKADVAKLPYSIDAADQSFDITRPQPQLFVTPSFAHLNTVLNEFAEQMAFTRGGSYAVETAKASGELSTLVFDTGIQLSGVVSESVVRNDEVHFVRCNGPAALAYSDVELSGHSKEYHVHGYSSPIGVPLGFESEWWALTENELTQKHSVYVGAKLKWEFTSGISLQGVVKSMLHRDGKLLVIAFSNCTVSKGSEVLFAPEWGVFDYLTAEKVVSAFPGAADATAWGITIPKAVEATHTRKTSTADQKRYVMYSRISEIGSLSQLADCWIALQENYPNEWLMIWELWQRAQQLNSALSVEIQTHIDKLSVEFPHLKRCLLSPSDILPAPQNK